MKKLTPPQKKLLEFLKEFNRANGWMPTIRECCDFLGYTSSESAHAVLLALVKKRKIVRGTGARMIRIA